jgi:hypothetical protein
LGQAYIVSPPATPIFVPPLIIAVGWDVWFYSSEDALNRDIEPWFPSDVDYRAFDSEGRKLELSVKRESNNRRFPFRETYERVVVRAVENEPEHARELRTFLADWLPMVGAPTPGSDTPLAELLRSAIEHGDLDR